LGGSAPHPPRPRRRNLLHLPQDQGSGWMFLAAISTIQTILVPTRNKMNPLT